MALIGNTPFQQTVLRLEARKSFSLGLWFKDSTGRGLDLSDSDVRLVAKAPPFGVDDSNNLFTNGVANVVSPSVGYARIDLQATDLDLEVGEYAFAIVLVTGGYSAVVVKGVIDVQPNTEAASLLVDYESANPPTSLQVTMRGSQTIEVITGAILQPGTQVFSDSDKAKLDSIQAGIPAGGLPGEVLAKTGGADFAVGWVAQSGGGGGALDATGVPASYVPTANGANSWSWALNLSGVTEINGLTGDVTLDLDDLDDTATRLAMTPAERDAVAALGTAATAATGDFLPSTGISGAAINSGEVDKDYLPDILSLNGVEVGVGEPGIGFTGVLYIQLEV